MTLKLAESLHTGDEVRIKRTGEIVQVGSILKSGKTVVVCAMSSEGFVELLHKEIK